jgi:uncharacterized DUF497 family protein
MGFESVSRLDWPGALEVEDTRFDYGERRWRAIGKIDGRLHVVVYAIRDDTIRVISLRKANPREARLHAHVFSTRTADRS